jgi:hypothetical protein
MDETPENLSAADCKKNSVFLEIVITFILKDECGRRDLNPSFKQDKAVFIAEKPVV